MGPLPIFSSKRAAQVVASVVCVCLTGWSVPDAACQDEPYFQPHFEPTPTPKPPAPPPIFSFGRFEDSFREMCAEMELDGRRARLVRIAEDQGDSEKVCISCRSLWRSIVSACGKLGPKPTPKPKKTKIKTPEATPAESEDSSATEAESGSDAIPSPSPSPTPPPHERYPSTALLDVVSRLSTEAYQADEGNGGILISLSNMVKVVRETKDLSAGERDYFDVLFTYLLAAWEGRIDSSTAPSPTPPADIEDFFAYG